MRDGEGVHHVVTVRVTGASVPRAAGLIARSIATSPLVKTAIAGRDPNWGRILAAAGGAGHGAKLKQDKVRLWIGDVLIVEGGVASLEPSAERRAGQVMKQDEYELRIDLGLGDAEAQCLACDLSHDYVSINADYRT